LYKFAAFVLIAIFLINCAGNKPRPDWTASQYYQYAKKLFNDEDYFDAVNHFTVVVLRYAGSNVADSAQYYLAESHYKMEEYLVAASEYEKLINNMSRSPLVPKAQFQLAESYYHLSPRAALDQTYTYKAIRAYQNFIEDNPTNKLKPKAEKRIAELRDKLAKKVWLSAEIYRKMRKFRAALIYYDEVLEKYYDTSWADDAQYGKILVHLEQEDYLSASKDIEKFEAQFPLSKLKNKVLELKSKIPAKISASNG